MGQPARGGFPSAAGTRGRRGLRRPPAVALALLLPWPPLPRCRREPVREWRCLWSPLLESVVRAEGTALSQARLEARSTHRRPWRRGPRCPRLLLCVGVPSSSFPAVPLPGTGAALAGARASERTFPCRQGVQLLRRMSLARLNKGLITETGTSRSIPAGRREVRRFC